MVILSTPSFLDVFYMETDKIFSTIDALSKSKIKLATVESSKLN